MKKIPRTLPIIIVALLFIVSVESKSVDPYKVLGVARDASQREIQKAFHKLSLQYHPDKNKNKGAQEKFAEINNAYDILSDEEKRKNYDLYGDEKGTPGFDGGSAGDHTYFRTGGPGQGGFSFRPDDWQNMGGQGGGSKSFSFSFGGPSSQRSFGFDIGDMFSNFFGGGMPGGSQFGGFSSSGRSEAGSRNSPKSISTVNSQLYKQEIVDKGTTWLLLSHTPSMKGKQYYESIIEEVAGSLQGVLKAGSINCEAESSLCKELSISPRKAPRLFVYSYKASESGSLTEFSGDLTAKSLKAFSQENLPRFSKRVNLAHLETFHGTVESLPRVVLLSTKRDTPVIWRALSGLYHKHFVFYDTEVHDVSDPTVKRLDVDALPAVVGWLPNGEKHILRTGIQVKDMKSSISDLSAVLDGFQKKIKQTASSYSKKSQAESGDNQIPLLVRSTFDAVCGEKTPLCIIGVFRSTKGKEKLNTILSSVSQKSLLRRQSSPSGSRESISYALLDASTQSSFLTAFDKSGFKSTDKLLLAYKPRKGKFAAFTGDLTNEEAERFIGSVLNGDVHFSKTRQKPTLK